MNTDVTVRVPPSSGERGRECRIIWNSDMEIIIKSSLFLCLRKCYMQLFRVADTKMVQLSGVGVDTAYLITELLFYVGHPMTEFQLHDIQLATGLHS